MDQTQIDKKNNKLTKLFDTISLNAYSPNQQDVERILGLEQIMKTREAAWLGIRSGV